MEDCDWPSSGGDTLWVSDRMLFDEMKRRVQTGWIPECGHYFAELITVLKERAEPAHTYRDPDRESWREL